MAVNDRIDNIGQFYGCALACSKRRLGSICSTVF